MITVFLSAFLLFQVQLVIGKAILPWFGGSAAVWMTCLLFFQALLFGGYLYAYLVVDRLAPRWQGIAHLAPLLLSLLLLPIAPSPTWKPIDASDPTWRILGLLAVHVGGPFFVLSATGPLIQAWSVRLTPGRSPYRLYALSNAGSLLGLVGYPFFVEPALPLRIQMTAWSVGYGVFVLLCGGWALRTALHRGEEAPVARELAPAAKPDFVARAFWVALSACGSAILLATTNQITQDVAPVPFLWMLPLALYLVSLILCFEGRRWYRRGLVGWTLVASLFVVAGVHWGQMDLGLWPQVAGYGVAQFACCMACHGELARIKPEPRHLTSFYLHVAAGGVLGASIVTLVAPLAFKTLADFPVALAACCLAWSAAKRFEGLREACKRRFEGRPLRSATAIGTALVGAVAVVPLTGRLWSGYLEHRGVLAASRNFYGVLQVSDEDAQDPARHRRRLSHGSTVHGVQFVAPASRGNPAAYYGPGTGVEAAFRALRKSRPSSLRIGVIGMGAGALAAFTRSGDALTFYEINPEVIRLARAWFTYWDDAVARGARLDVRVGDARLLLEKEPAEPYDVLVVDAFAGDAIPVHLLTTECFDLYEARLARGALLAVHVSNKFLYLAPVVRLQSERRGWSAVNMSSAADPAHGCFATDWVAASSDGALCGELRAQKEIVSPWPEVDLSRPWTDDFSSLLPLLR
ncbi:MAG TPA: fused MFS/spermidine synthase [Planctomycetota bacterium]|nr:fused MFS/spermidine synthase [Planctomycetota bacterium]